MKKTLLVSLSIISFIYLSNAQGVTSVDVGTQRLYMASDVSKPIDATGSPYVDQNFLPVRIKGYDNQLFTGRFNAYNGEMEINLGTKVIALDKSKSYELIYTQNNKTYRTYSFTTPNGLIKNGFLNVIKESENFILLKEEIIKYYDKVAAASSYQQDKPAKFSRENDNYYIKTSSYLKYIPTKKKDLLKVFPKNSKEIKSFLKENKISFKKEEDLIKVVSFLSTL